MVKEFIPTLIETIFWNAYTWESIRTELNQELKEIIENEDANRLFSLIKEDIKSQAKAKIEDAMRDIKEAIGAVAIRDKDHQDIIIAVLDRC